MSTTKYGSRTELQPRETRVRDVSDLDYETVAEYIESRDLDAHFERRGEQHALASRPRGP